MPPTIHELFDSPDYYLYEFSGDDVVFIRMDREAYHRSIFLDQRIEPLDSVIMKVESDLIAAWRDQQRLAVPPKGWIFHVANCGSTLLARALDRLQATLVLREPVPLRQLAVEHVRSAQGQRPHWDRRLRLVLTQLGKRYRSGAPIIIKANVPVNFILPEIMRAEPDAAAVLLYYPLHEYLLAILRSDAHRAWVQRITTELEPAIRSAIGDMSNLDVVQRAAALWALQVCAFADVLAMHPNTRSLDAGFFFSKPAPSIEASAALFGLHIGESEIDAVVSSSLFSSYSKNPQLAFDEQARAERARTVEVTLAADLVRAEAWIRHGPLGAQIPTRLSSPLVANAPDLIR